MPTQFQIPLSIRGNYINLARSVICAKIYLIYRLSWVGPDSCVIYNRCQYTNLWDFCIQLVSLLSFSTKIILNHYLFLLKSLYYLSFLRFFCFNIVFFSSVLWNGFCMCIVTIKFVLLCLAIYRLWLNQIECTWLICCIKMLLDAYD
jgi:hypothetical protein